MIETPPAATHVMSAFDPRRATTRLIVSCTVGIIVGTFAPMRSLSMHTLVGWNAGSLVLLGLCWNLIWVCDASVTRHRAAASDPGRTLVWFLVIAGSLFSLFAATFALHPMHALGGAQRAVLITVCQGAIVIGWALTHTAFTFRYAHLYYRDDAEGIGGLEFPGGRSPTYFDMAYFAFTVGMTFQVSDVTISSPVIRRTVLLHALLSFVYNTAIVALALNIIFQLLQ